MIIQKIKQLIPTSIRESLSYQRNKIRNKKTYKERLKTIDKLFDSNQITDEGKIANHNVFVIVIDALRYDRISYTGYNRNTTPFLDSIIPDCLFYENAHSASCWTLPSTASLFTGKYPYQHGARIISSGIKEINKHSQPNKLRKDVLIFPEILSRFGYELNLSGSITYVEPNLLGRVPKFEFRKRKKASEIFKTFLRTFDSVKAKTFNYMHLGDVHQPINIPSDFENIFEDINGFELSGWANAPEPDDSRFEYFKNKSILLYDSSIRYVDYQIELFWNELAKKDMLDNSTIIITADHGEALWDHIELDKMFVDPTNWPYLGHGQNFYQELIHIPLIVKSPFLDKNVINKNVSLVDIAPSLLNLLGFSNKINFDGLDIFNSFTGERAIYSQDICRGYEKQGIRKGNLKLIHDKEEDIDLLFDLSKDPREKNPLNDNELLASMKSLITIPRSNKGEKIETDDELLKRLRELGYL